MYKRFFYAILVFASSISTNIDAEKTFNKVSGFEKMAVDLLSDFIKNDKQKVHFGVVSQKLVPGLGFSGGLTLLALPEKYGDDLVSEQKLYLNLEFGNVKVHLQPGVYASLTVDKNFIREYKKWLM